MKKRLAFRNDIEYNKSCVMKTSLDWVWRSLVACLNGVQEAGGSNPLTQTLNGNPMDSRFFEYRKPHARRGVQKSLSGE